MFSCESFKVFKNIYFTEHLQAAAFVFCIVFWNFGYKGLLKDSPVFQKQ